MNKLTIILLTLALAVPFVGIVATTETRKFVITEGSGLVTVDGDSYLVNIPPVSTTNKTYEHVAAENKLMMSTHDFLKMIGGSIDYNTKSRIFTFNSCGKKIGLEYGKSQVIVDGKIVSVPIGMVVENGRTQISPKVLCDVLGYPSQYDETAKSLTMELPMCPIKLPPDALVNAYAKVNSFDESSKRLLVTDCTGSLLDIDTQGTGLTFNKSEMLHLYIRQQENGLFKPYVIEKTDMAFGSGKLQASFGSEEYILNGLVRSGRDKFMLIDGVPYIPLDTASSILGTTIFPSDLGAGQVSINSMRMKVTFLLDNTKLSIDMQDGTQPKTIEMDKPCILVNGIVYLPAVALNLISGGETTISVDGGKIDILLEKILFSNNSTSVNAKLDSMDCEKGVGSITTENGRSMQIVLLPQPTNVSLGSQKCKDFIVGQNYSMLMDSIVKNDGSVTNIVSAWTSMTTNYNQAALDRIVTGTVTEMKNPMNLKLKIDGSDVEPISITGDNSQLKLGWRIKALLLRTNKNDAYMMDYAVIDSQSSQTMKCYSLTLTSSTDSWSGVDDNGTKYELSFTCVPWNLPSFLSSGSKYIVKGFEREPAKISVVDFLKSPVSLIERTTFSTVYDKSSKTSMMHAFRYNGKTYVNYKHVSKTYIMSTLPEIVITDNSLNLAVIKTGTRTANVNGKLVELENYPICLGFGNYVYIETTDAAKISEATFENTNEGKLIVIKPNSRLAVTSDYYFTAKVEEIDKEGFKAKATDEFGRSATLLFVYKTDLDNLEVGSSYVFTSKNIDWNNYIVFKSLGKTEMVESKSHKTVFGSIESIDCQNQSFVVKDVNGNMTKCVFKTNDNDCSLLKVGQNVGLDGINGENDVIRVVKKWHYNNLPEPKTQQFVLTPGDFVKDSNGNKVSTSKVNVIDGQYYIDINAAQSIYVGTKEFNYQNSKRFDFLLWGNIVTFWSDKDEYIVNGKLEKLIHKFQFIDGVMFVPATFLLPYQKGTSKMSEDGLSMTIEVTRCPIPIWHKPRISKGSPLAIAKVDGVELITGKEGYGIKILVSDLRQLEGMKEDVCASIEYTYHYIGGNEFALFADVIKIVECAKP